MTNFVKTEKTPEGNLRLILHPEAREELLELYEREKAGEISTGEAESEVLEYLIGNGFGHVQPEDVGALTSAPIISDELEEDEKTGEQVPVVGTHVYAYMDYQVRSFVEDLAECGESVWIGSRVIAATAPPSHKS